MLLFELQVWAILQSSVLGFGIKIDILLFSTRDGRFLNLRFIPSEETRLRQGWRQDLPDEGPSPSTGLGGHHLEAPTKATSCRKGCDSKICREVKRAENCGSFTEKKV